MFNLTTIQRSISYSEEDPHAKNNQIGVSEEFRGMKSNRVKMNLKGKGVWQTTGENLLSFFGREAHIA